MATVSEEAAHGAWRDFGSFCQCLIGRTNLVPVEEGDKELKPRVHERGLIYTRPPASHGMFACNRDESL